MDSSRSLMSFSAMKVPMLDQFPWIVLMVLSLMFISWPAIGQETRALENGWVSVTGADTFYLIGFFFRYSQNSLLG